MKKQAKFAFLMDGIGKQITGWRNAGLQDSLSGKPFINVIIKESVGGVKKLPDSYQSMGNEESQENQKAELFI